MDLETLNKANVIADQMRDLRHLSESLSKHRPGDIGQSASLLRLAIEYEVLDEAEIHDKVLTSVKVKYEALKDELTQL